MLLLRPTQALAKKIKVRLTESRPLNENRFADWTARLFRVMQVQYVLATNTASLYSVVLPARGLTSERAFGEAVVAALREFMIADGCGSLFDQRIAPETGRIVLAKALSRTVTGAMNDLVYQARYWIEARGGPLSDASFLLNASSMSPLDYRNAREAYLAMRDAAAPTISAEPAIAPPTVKVSGRQSVPAYQIRVYGNEDALPEQAEAMFARQLADSRKPMPVDRWDKNLWRYVLVCAVTQGGEVLGGVHLDVGPINGEGPLAHHRLAYLERTLVRPEYRRQGIATALLTRAIEALGAMGCEYIRCHNDWDNPAETALFRKCGFALVDLNGERVEGPSYLAVRSVGKA